MTNFIIYEHYENMRISNVDNYNNHNNNFSGYTGSEYISKKMQGNKLLIHETSFFRDMKPLEYAKRYLSKNMPPEAKLNIIDGACSNGEETYTLAMLFSNMKDKLHITGFDLSEKCLEKARKGIFSIFKIKNKYFAETYDFKQWPCLEDEFLLSGRKLSHTQENYKKEFENSFEKISKKEANIPFSERLNNFLTAPFSLKTESFKVKPELAKNCDFKFADINTLADNSEFDSADLFLFRNAMYHLTDDFTSSEFGPTRTLKPEKELREILGTLLNSVKSKLKDGGLFIIGSNEVAETGDKKGLIQKIIEDNGFSPAYSKNGFTSVWKKDPIQ